MTKTLIIPILLFAACTSRTSESHEKDLTKEYYPNGEIQGQGQIAKGEKEGQWTYFYENGEVGAEINYKSGQPEGKATYYFESGLLESTTNWMSGIENGEAFHYYENGRVKDHGFYKNGKQHDKFTFYFENGNIELVQYFMEGEKIKEQLFYPDGKLETEAIINNETKTALMYYETGEKYGELVSKNGKNVVSKFFYRDGSLKAIMENNTWATYNQKGQKVENLYTLPELIKSFEERLK